MWRPLEIFLYDRSPIRSEARLSDRLAAMPVRIRYMNATARFARDAAQAALARGVFHFASTIAGFYFCRNLLGDRRAASFSNLVVNVSASEAKAIAKLGSGPRSL